jgi:hypothetical protein
MPKIVLNVTINLIHYLEENIIADIVAIYSVRSNKKYDYLDAQVIFLMEKISLVSSKRFECVMDVIKCVVNI